MKTLSPILTIGSGPLQFRYRQLLRKGMHAIYEQWQFGKLVAYEVFKIQSHNGYHVGDTYIEPAESVPSASAWGIHGFTFARDNKQGAVAKMVRMMNGGAW